MRDEWTAAAFTLVRYMQHRNCVTLLLHATLILVPAIGEDTSHQDLSIHYTVTIWNK